MLQNVIAGLQGIIDHALVGQFVGYIGNAAIGVSWQIFLVVMVFMSSLFTGMGVLVARFAGANDHEKVNRTVYQATISSIVMAFLVLAPLGYFLAPWLLELINATPEVRAEALPYVRVMFVFSFGMFFLFMVGHALRSAGDAKTPLMLGIALTVLNIVLNVVFIRGVGPIPAFGTMGSAIGTSLAAWIVCLFALYRLFTHRWVIGFHGGSSLRPDFDVIRTLFRFGIPAGIQGVAMNIGGVVMLAFVGSLAQSSEAQAAYTVGYTQLFSLITWTSVGLMGAAAAVAGQNLGAGNPDRSIKGVHVATRIGLGAAAGLGVLFLAIPRTLLSIFGMDDPVVVDLAVELLAYLSVSGIFVTTALAYTGGLQGTGDTTSPLYISIISQVIIPIGVCAMVQATGALEAHDIWLAIVLGHVTRAGLSMIRFRQAKWRDINVEIGAARA
jgi:putative MATE family efflux protein